MLTKIAAFILAGSVATLAVAGVTGMTNHDFNRRFKRFEHSFKDRVHIKRRIHHERKAEIRARIAEARAEAQAQHDARAEVLHSVGEAADVVGTYAFDANGNPFGKLPWSAHVELQFHPNGRYELRLRTNIADQLEEEANWGLYRVRDNHVILYSGHDNETHDFVIDGDRLLFDADWTARLALKAVGIDQTYMTKLKQ